MPGAVLPLVLRKDDSLVLAVYDEKAAALVELEGEANRYSGDYRECEVLFNPHNPTRFAHASTTTLTYTEVVEAAGAEESDVHRFSLRTLFSIPMSHVVISLAFSPQGSYLVSYAMMDLKRTLGGNLSVFDTESGALLRRGMQARWPAMLWTEDEAYVVRPVQGWLHVLDGQLHTVGASATPLPMDAEEQEKEVEVGEEGSTEASATHAASAAAAGGAALSKLDLMLAQDKEIEYATAPTGGRPMLALFTPFYKNRQATLCLYRLPNLRDGPLYQLSFGRAETASLIWSPSGNHVALLVKAERDPSGKSYYGAVQLHLIDVLNRSITEVKLKGEGESVHDCQWAPNSDELLVVHGKMPRNKCTLLNKKGVALMTFGEAPRNVVLWAPNCGSFIVGGSGNLAGDYQFYTRPQMVQTPTTTSSGAAAGMTSVPVAASATCTGEFNEKCSFQTWAPDSHNFLCATVFTRLRMDNKLVFVKRNGARVLTVKYPVLYGAHWVAMHEPAGYTARPVSPRVATEEAPKPQAYRPPGGGASRAAALLRRDPVSAQPAKAAGPVGATVVAQKKKKRH